MKPLTHTDCAQLSAALAQGADLLTAFGNCQAGAVENGFWRLFSRLYPEEGIAGWNVDTGWRSAWGLADLDVIAIGEDVFGNQLMARSPSDSLLIWNHENGEFSDLLLPPVQLLESAIESGVDWIDFYGVGSDPMAKAHILDLSLDCHLHWTTPLILGGSVSLQNTSIVERSAHLIGHADLWRQVQGLPPGTSIIPQ